MNEKIELSIFVCGKLASGKTMVSHAIKRMLEAKGIKVDFKDDPYDTGKNDPEPKDDIVDMLVSMNQKLVVHMETLQVKRSGRIKIDRRK
jgi:galactitol-specific phosphotransferase system IIB component